MAAKNKVGNRLFWARSAIAEISQTATPIEKQYIAKILLRLDEAIADFGSNYPTIDKRVTAINPKQAQDTSSDF